MVLLTAGTVGLGLHAVDQLGAHTTQALHDGSARTRQLLALRESYQAMSAHGMDPGAGAAAGLTRLVEQRRREHEAEGLRLLQRLQSQARPGAEQEGLLRIGELGARYVAALAALASQHPSTSAAPSTSSTPATPPLPSPLEVNALQGQLFEAIHDAHGQQQAAVEHLLSQAAADSRQATRLMVALALVLGLSALGVPWAAAGLVAALRRPGDRPPAAAPSEPAARKPDAGESEVLASVHHIRHALDELVQEVQRVAPARKDAGRS